MSRNLAAPPPADDRCPDGELLAELAQGALVGRERAQVAAHIERCPKCLAALASLSAKDPPSENTGDSQPPALQSTFLSIGDVVAGKYRIDSVIGSGGMGTVYRAHHLALRSDVAIKVLRPERVSEVNARRFAREARATSSLRSEHAVRTFDIDTLPNGVPYIVMEYLEGSDLARILKSSGAVAIVDALKYGIEACDAVGEAHGHAIIHRDIKPANLFVTTEGIVKVLDFGLAKNLPRILPDAGSEMTQANLLLGSPHYMSPEQLRSAKDLDARADIWSLGATLYHVMAGVPPFAGANVYLLAARVLKDDAPLLSTHLRSAPRALDAVLAKCLRRDPAERYPSCAALGHALEEVLLMAFGHTELAARRGGSPLATDKGRVPAFTTPDIGLPRLHTQELDGASAIARFAEDIDDAEPTVLGDPQFAPPGASSGAGVPKVYDEDSHDDAEAGTILMATAADHEEVARSIPRIYDEDDEAAGGTKLMADAPPRIFPPGLMPRARTTMPIPRAPIPYVMPPLHSQDGLAPAPMTTKQIVLVLALVSVMLLTAALLVFCSVE